MGAHHVRGEGLRVAVDQRMNVSQQHDQAAKKAYAILTVLEPCHQK